jgi:hypothetical protein
MVKADGQPPNWRTPMNARNLSCGLIATLTAGALSVGYSASASAEEPYQRVTVAELKRAIKQQEEEQKRLEATPEYQAKKRQHEADKKRREQEKQLAKENELRLKLQAVELERMKLENKQRANQQAGTDDGSGSGSGGVAVTPTTLDVPRLMVDPLMFPFGWVGKFPAPAPAPLVGVKQPRVPQQPIKFGR